MSRRTEFIETLLSQFPDGLDGFNDELSGYVHLEVSQFRGHVEKAVRDGRFWYLEKAFRLIETFIDGSGDDVDNALEISFVEDFALGSFTKEEVYEVLKRLSKPMRATLEKHSEQWRL
ncbi:MAG: hypothetical protein AAF662_01560 [Pseudomonadota bacterium]